MNISLPSMLKWLAPVAAAILCFLLVQGDLLAQNPPAKPGQPTGVRASPGGDLALEVIWTAPGSDTVTAYDVRYILTSADESVEGNWLDFVQNLDKIQEQGKLDRSTTKGRIFLPGPKSLHLCCCPLSPC